MYLASYQVSHHGLHLFVVTVRVKPGFIESKLVCIVNVVLQASQVITARGAPYVTILFLRTPQGCAISSEYLLQMH